MTSNADVSNCRKHQSSRYAYAFNTNYYIQLHYAAIYFCKQIKCTASQMAHSTHFLLGAQKTFFFLYSYIKTDFFLLKRHFLRSFIDEKKHPFLSYVFFLHNSTRALLLGIFICTHLLDSKKFASRDINSCRNLFISSSILRISASKRSRMLENSVSRMLKSPNLMGIFLLLASAMLFLIV